MNSYLNAKTGKSFAILLSILCFTSCSSERMIYKRVGGNHLHLISGQKELFWFNGMHGIDPANPMFQDIFNEFGHFKPDFVLVEGSPYVSSDSMQAIKRGESSYVTYLAYRQKIPYQSTEPPDSVIFSYLERSYTKEQLLAMYIIRQMVQWNRERIGDDFENELVRFANSINTVLKYSEQETSKSQIAAILEPYTGMQMLANSNWRNFDAKTYIYFTKNTISEIYEATLTFRNKYLISLIQEEINNCNKLFIMMGFDHVKEIRNELDEIFGNNDNL